jgi:hypothetical protein
MVELGGVYDTRERTAEEFWSENLKERDLDGRIIFKRMLKK